MTRSRGRGRSPSKAGIELGAQYRVLASLESGGEGDVWLVEDLRRDGALAALKILRGDRSHAPEEFRKLATLRHRSLARVYDAGILPGSGARYLTTAYFAGAPLTALPAPFSWDLFFTVLREFCEVIAYLNDAGFRHGDVKPGHLLFAATPALRVRLIDLGHAARLDCNHSLHAGTPAYAAPELWGKGQAGRNTDLYALALSCLEVFCGGLPMSFATAAEWREWHVRGDRVHAFAHAVLKPPQSVMALLLECLAPDPSDRPRDARAMIERLPAADHPLAEDEFVPSLSGRDEILRTLEAWCRDPHDGAPAVMLLEGNAGIGKSRLLRALARAMQANGSAVEIVECGGADSAPHAPKQADAPPILATSPRELLIMDGLHPREARGERSLAQWLSAQAPNEGGTLRRALIAIAADCDERATACLESELRRAHLQVERLRLGPIDFDASLKLVEECLQAPVDAAEIQRIASNGAGIPKRIIEMSGVNPSPNDAVRGSGMHPDLESLLASLPAPVPVHIVISALGWTRGRFFRELASAREDAPLLEGVHPDLVLHPLATARRTGHEVPLGTLLTLAEEWEKTADRAHDWAPLCLRYLAGQIPARADVLALAGQLSRAKRWRALALFAARFCAPFPEMRWLLLRALWREGRFAEAFERLNGYAPDPKEVPAEAAADIARLLADCGALSSALEFFRTAAANLPQHSERIELAIDAARAALVCGERDQAVELVRQFEGNGSGDATKLARASPALANSYARLLVQLGHPERAEAHFHSALHGARREGAAGSGTIVAALGGLALVDRARGDLVQAEQRLRVALRYARVSGYVRDHAAELQALRGNFAAILYRAGRVDAALQTYEQLEGEVRRGGNWRLLPHVGLGLGTIYRERGEFFRALRTLRRARRDAERLQNDSTVFGIERNLGEIYLLLGDPATAYRHRLHALRIARELRDPELIRHGRYALGAVLVRRGSYAEGLGLLERALNMPAPKDGRRLSAMIYAFLGEAKWHLGEESAALAAWAHCCRDAIRSGNVFYVCRGIGGMAWVLSARGDIARAQSLISRATEWARAAGAPALTRVPLQIERLRIEFRVTGPTPLLLERLHALYHSARGHGLREEALGALLLYAAHAEAFRLPLPERSQEFIRAMLRRSTPDDRRALEERLDVSLTRWVARSDGGEDALETVAVEPGRQLEALLESLRLRVGADAARIVVDPDGRRIVVAHAGVPSATAAADDGEARIALDLWVGAPRVVAHFLGVSQDRLRTLTGGESAALISRALPVVARAVIDEKESALREVRLELDHLREQRLADRERMRTETLTQRLELQERAHVIRTKGPAAPGHPSWVAESAAMREIERNLQRWGQSGLPVFIHGESGTGKDILARRIHDRSARAARQCHVENCSALPPALFEAELFGYAAGAFTGAERERSGILKRIDGGTLVLDQIDELPLEVQGKLLRVLESRAFRPLGSGQLEQVDLRIISTCRHAPKAALEGGMLRADLYYRLQGVEIHIPPLRARKEEIPALIASYLDWHSARLQLPVPVIEPAALARLQSYAWPGNVRELGNLVMRWLLLRLRNVTAADVMYDDAEGLRTDETTAGATPPLFMEGLSWREAMRRFQQRFLLQCLERNGWHRSRTAAALGLSRRQLHNLLGKLELG